MDYGGPMPLAVYFNSIIAVNGYVYVAGGEIVSTHYNTVYYAPLNADGTVGAEHDDRIAAGNDL